MNPRKTNVFLAIVGSSMPSNGKIILLHMLSQSSENGRRELRVARADATHERLASACCIAVPTVQRQMAKILLKGLIVTRGEYYQLMIKPIKPKSN